MIFVPPPVAAWVTLAKAKQEEKKEGRKCLRCGKIFLSDGPHHRLGPKCRRIAAKDNTGTI